MSLINQMLKDLDARHEAGTRSRLHREVRALPGAKENKVLRLTVASLLVLTLGAAAWWSFERYLSGAVSRLLQPAEPVAIPSLPPPPVVASTDSAVVSTPVVEQTAQPSAETSTRENISHDAQSGLKLAAMLDKLPIIEPISPKPAAVAPPSQKRVGGGVPAGDGGAAPKAAPAAGAPKMAAVGSVDKTFGTKTLRERSEADYRRAVTLVNGARIGEATDLLLDVLRQDGGHGSSRQLLTRLLIEQRRSEEAMAILAEGLASQPGQVSWAMTLARLQVDRGDLAGAARTLQQSQSFASGNADYQGFAGHVQHRLGHEKEAVDFYQGAVKLAPSDGRWWLGLGLALEADRRPTEAREAYLRARASTSLNADLAAIVDQKLR